MFIEAFIALWWGCFCPVLCLSFNWCHFFSKWLWFWPCHFCHQQLPNCPFLAMFNALSPVLLSGAAHLGCQKDLLYCSVSQGLSCFMTFQHESMIEISICSRRELSTGPEIRKWVASSFGGIGLSVQGWKACSLLFQLVLTLWISSLFICEYCFWRNMSSLDTCSWVEFLLIYVAQHSDHRFYLPVPLVDYPSSTPVNGADFRPWFHG